MSGKSWIGIMLLGMLASHWIEAAPVPKEKNEQTGEAVTLSAPARGTVVGHGDLLCAWRHRAEVHSGPAVAWELAFIPQNGGPPQMLRLDPSEALALATGFYSYRIPEIRQLLRQPGRYQWRISAVYGDGRRVTSRFSSVVVGVGGLGMRFDDSASRFEVRMGSTRRNGTGAFKELLAGMANPDPLRRYADLDLIFHQGGGRWHVKERVFLHSSVGMGGGLGLDVRVCQNSYFALRPGAAVSASWRSAGLKDYSAMATEWRVGCDLVVRPHGYVTLKAAYIPSLRERYATLDGDLLTFKGSGWEAGVRVVFSHNLIKPFSLGGLRVDFSRMPIEVYIGEIEDSCTGTRMKQTRLSIGYTL